MRTGIWLAITITSLVVVACEQGSSAGPAGGQGLSPGVPGFGAAASVPRPGFLEKSAVRTSNLFLRLGARITPGAEPNTRDRLPTYTCLVSALRATANVASCSHHHEGPVLGI